MDGKEKIVEYLKKNHVFFYATVDEGKARVRPFGFVQLINDRIYVGMGDFKRSCKETLANPYIEICSCDGPTWLRVRAKAVPDNSVNDIIFEANPFLKEKYGPGSDLNHAAFWLDEIDADYNGMDGTFEKWV